MRPFLPALAVFFSAQAALADVTVFAAASLKTALDEIASDYAQATGVPVTLSYGGSAALAKQIAEGAPADLFLSASTQWMDDLEARGLLQPGTRRDLVGNRLILVGPAGARPVTLDATLDLAGLLTGGKLAMALVEAVPAGQYGKEALESLGLWDGVKGSVVQTDNVRLALSLVALGEAALGVVYASDAVAEPGVAVVGTFPAESHSPIVYPGAVVADAGPEAAAFLDHLGGPEAGAVFLANGFLPLP